MKANTNLASLFSYIEKTTNTEANKLLDGIQRELKGYREKFNLPGKTFIELDGANKIVAFGFSEEE